MKKIFLLVVLLQITTLSLVFADSVTDRPDWLWNYNGDITGVGRVMATLVFDKSGNVSGVFCKYGVFVDLQISGKLSRGRHLVFSVHSKLGQEIAAFRGDFVESDPRGHYSADAKLEFEVLVGSYTELSGSEEKALYLQMSSGTFGNLEHRYRSAGAEDDSEINNSALAIWTAIKNDKPETVAQFVEYPLSISLPDETLNIRNRDTFVENYQKIVTNKLKSKIKVGLRPRDIVFTSDSRRAFISNEVGASIAVIDVASSKVVNTFTLPEGSLPMGLVLARDNQTLYIATGRGHNVLAMNVANGAIKGSVDAGRRPWGLAISPDGSKLYTANGPSNDVSVIDVATFKVVTKITVGSSPWGVLIGPKH